MDRIIADTGADVTALLWVDCQTLQLDLAHARPGQIGGVGGWSTATVFFAIFVQIDGQEHPCRVHVDFTGNERLLGRDILNRFEIVFRGPKSELVVNP